MQHADAIADREHDLHVVLDQEDRHVPAVGEIAQNAGKAERLLHRQAGGGLVEQATRCGRPTKRQRKIEAALIAVADIRRRHVGQCGEIEFVHHFGDVGVRHRP